MGRLSRSLNRRTKRLEVEASRPSEALEDLLTRRAMGRLSTEDLETIEAATERFTDAEWSAGFPDNLTPAERAVFERLESAFEEEARGWGA